MITSLNNDHQKCDCVDGSIVIGERESYIKENEDCFSILRLLQDTNSLEESTTVLYKKIRNDPIFPRRLYP